MRSHLRTVGVVMLIAAVASQIAAQKPEIVVETGHTHLVKCVSFSPDGRLLASSGQDKTIKLWDVASGLALRTLIGHTGGVSSLAFDPSGLLLASGSEDQTISIWDVASGRRLRSLRGHVSGVSLSFSPDGKTLVSASGDDAINVWDVASGNHLRTIEAGSGGVFSIAISSDGSLLASGGLVPTIKLWDLTNGNLVRSFQGHVGRVNSVVFSPDSTQLVSGSEDRTIKFWEVASGREIRTLSPGSVSSIVLSRDGKLLASSTGRKTTLWDIPGGSELSAIETNMLPDTSPAISTDGRLLAAGGGQVIELWDLRTGRQIRTLAGHRGLISSVLFSPDGTALASGSYDQPIKLWDVTSARELKSLSHPPSIQAMAFSPTGKLLASGAYRTIKLWDLSIPGAARTLNAHPSWIRSIVFSRDGNTLLSVGDDGVKLWDVMQGSETRSYTIPSKPVAFNGKVIASTKGRDITLWDASTGRELRDLSNASSSKAEIAFLNEKVLVVKEDHAISLWDVETGAVLHTFMNATGEIGSMAFSPDGRLLAFTSADQIRVWDVETGLEIYTLSTQSKTTALAFSSDGNLLASGSWNTRITCWHASSGKELASLIAVNDTDWLVTTPEGMFDGTAAALKQVNWRFGNNTQNFAPVEAYFNDFFHPGLLREVFEGKQAKLPEGKELAKRDRRRPLVTMEQVQAPNVSLPKSALSNTTSSTTTLVRPDSRNIAIRIGVVENIDKPADGSQPKAGGARDLRLFRNGSLVKVWHGDVLKGRGGLTLEVNIPIVAGPNNFTAYAFNHDNIKSSDATLTVTGADSLKRKGTLRILAVGVSLYANRGYNLNYTTDDATSFAAQLKLQQERTGRYQPVEIITLLNENATKANILAELKRLAAAVQPEDAVVVYFSGHGKAAGDHFYLVPHDLGYAGSRDQLSAEGLKRILTHSISDLELEEAFRGIDAGQMFMIIDACNSGQALENKDEPRRGPMNTRGLAQLAYEKGMYILTASQNVEEAFVSERLKHSYLTYALVEEGLKTKAADADHNGEVLLQEWFDYALARVPKLREETLQSKSLEEVNPKLKAVRTQKSQTPRVFYRREPDAQPMIVAAVR